MQQVIPTIPEAAIAPLAKEAALKYLYKYLYASEDTGTGTVGVGDVIGIGIGIGMPDPRRPLTGEDKITDFAI